MDVSVSLKELDLPIHGFCLRRLPASVAQGWSCLNQPTGLAPRFPQHCDWHSASRSRPASIVEAWRAPQIELAMVCDQEPQHPVRRATATRGFTCLLASLRDQASVLERASRCARSRELRQNAVTTWGKVSKVGLISPSRAPDPAPEEPRLRHLSVLGPRSPRMPRGQCSACTA
jgi:hypothetical protein